MPPPRGILNATGDEPPFRLERVAPAADLAPFVELLWIVSWDLLGREPHVQHTLPHPCVHLVVEAGTARVYGVLRTRFTRTLEGTGRVIGAKFRPGGFRPFLKSPVSALTDRVAELHEVLGLDGPALEATVRRTPDQPAAVAAIEAWLRAQSPQVDPMVEMVSGLVDRAAQDRSVTKVAHLSHLAGMSPRSLQRLFADYVGVGPKWVIQRYRLLEAAERAATGPEPDWAQVAADLGYFDQAHLIRDFTATVGVPPGQYARASRGS